MITGYAVLTPTHPYNRHGLSVRWKIADGPFRCSSGGIGNQLAREFHSHGLRVFATARKIEKIVDLKDLGIECLTLTVDDHESVVKCFKDVERAVGSQGVAFLVNNAGTGTSLCWLPPLKWKLIILLVVDSSQPACHRDFS